MFVKLPYQLRLNGICWRDLYVDHIGFKGFNNPEQIQALANDSCEIGNHSMTHADLTLHHFSIEFEVQQSRM